MSTILFHQCAGVVHVAMQESSGGFYELDPPLPSNADAKCLIQNAPLSFSEIVQPSVTLDDARSLYVFGSAWSEMSVNGIILLGPDSAGGKILRSFEEWYETNRVSKLMDSVGLSVCDKPYEVFVVGLQLGQADPQFNRQEFSIRMLTAKDI